MGGGASSSGSGSAVATDATTAWRLEYAIEHSRYLRSAQEALKLDMDASQLRDMTSDIARLKAIPMHGDTQTDLQASLRRLNVVYQQQEEILARSSQQYDKDSEEHQTMLREL